MMLRAEVKTFCAAAETLLSPVLLGSPLNEEERAMISLYMDNLLRNSRPRHARLILSYSAPERSPLSHFTLDQMTPPVPEQLYAALP